jgi:TP901 family phage tail tape measure protein
MAIGASLGSATLDLRVDTSELNKGLAAAEKEVGTSSKRMEGGATQWGKTLSKNVTLPIVALGTAAFASFAEIEKGQNQVTLATGATGKALDSLHTSYRNVAAEGRKYGLTHEQIGKIVGDLNTQFGVTGTELESMSKHMIQFTRATGVDASGAVMLVNRVMKDWSVSSKDMPKVLDKLTVAGQKTGVSVDTLSQNVVKFGVPMRNFGFTMDEGIALLSSFEAQGVNTELVMGSLRIATGKFAKEGKDLKTGLWETIDAIKNAGSNSEAAAIGMEIFGRRAGADMAKAIQEGRFEIDDLVKALGNSDGATAEVAANTVTAADKMREAWARVSLALAPLGAAISDGISKAMDLLSPIISGVGSAMSSLPGPMKSVILVVGGLAAALGPVLLIAGKLVTMFGSMASALRLAAIAKGIATAATWLYNAALRANPIGIVVTALMALVAGFMIAWQSSETFRNVVTSAFSTVASVASSVWNNVIKPVFDAFMDAAKMLWENFISPYFTLISGIVTTVAGVIKTTWETVIRPAIDAIATAITTLWTTYFSVYFNLIKGIIDTVGNTATWLWNTAISPAFTAIQTGVSTLWNFVRPLLDLVAKAFTAIGTAGSAVWTALETAFEAIKTGITTFWNAVIKPIGNFISGAFDKIGDAAGAMKDAVKTAFDFIENNLISPIKTAFKAVGNMFIKVVNAIIKGAKAIAKAINWIPGVEISIDVDEIPQLADGGVINKPTLAVVGEDGPEAVIPLGAKRRKRGQQLMTRAALAMGMDGMDPSAGLKYLAEGGIYYGGMPNATIAAIKQRADENQSRGLFGSVWDKFKQGVGFLMKAIPNITLPQNGWGQMFSRLPGMVVTAAKAFARELFGASENAHGGQNIMNAKRESERVMGRPYGWGAGRPPGWHHPSYDCSGYASSAWWEASGKKGHSGTTMSLFPISKRAKGDEPFQFVFRGMDSSNPRQQHMGAKILGDIYDFGNPGAKNRGGSWTHAMVPPHVPGFAEGTDRITREGLAYLHRDEEVVPANERGRSGRAIIGKLAENVHFHEPSDAERIIGDLGNRFALRIGVMQ